MEITLNDTEPIESYPYLEVSGEQNNEGRPKIIHKRLPIYFGTFEHNKSDIDYLIICSDLQGISEDEEGKLLGVVLPEFLKLLIEIEKESELEATKVGVLLCGDLYTNLNKRGRSGDVREVWIKFNETFDWVIGVAGNHDRFGNEEEEREFKAVEGIHLLHENIVIKDELKIGGISGIIGRNDKVNRVEEKEYLRELRKLLKKDIDLLLLHETPDFPEFNLQGNPKLREVIENIKLKDMRNIFCGHCHWDKTLIMLQENVKVMNTDAKVVLLKRTNNK